MMHKEKEVRLESLRKEREGYTEALHAIWESQRALEAQETQVTRMLDATNSEYFALHAEARKSFRETLAAAKHVREIATGQTGTVKNFPGNPNEVSFFPDHMNGNYVQLRPDELEVFIRCP